MSPYLHCGQISNRSRVPFMHRKPASREGRLSLKSSSCEENLPYFASCNDRYDTVAALSAWAQVTQKKTRSRPTRIYLPAKKPEQQHRPRPVRKHCTEREGNHREDAGIQGCRDTCGCTRERRSLHGAGRRRNPVPRHFSSIPGTRSMAGTPSCAGVFGSFGTHDRPGRELLVSGRVRYMNAGRRKWKSAMDRYIARVTKTVKRIRHNANS
jgi:hypothetical protein